LSSLDDTDNVHSRPEHKLNAAPVRTNKKISDLAPDDDHASMKLRPLFWTLALTMTLLGGAPLATAQTPDDAYSAQAQEVWDRAERAFSSNDFLEAIRLYNMVRTQYTYSAYVALADLRIADAYFEQERFATSIEQYRTFIKLYPNHERILYANWRIAHAFYRQVPDDWFFLPPAYERELARARDAERELRLFLRRFPNTEFTEQANRFLLLSRRRLADHELYVATFYLERDNPRAAAMRLTYLLQNYSGLGLDPNALFLLARAYVELKDVDRALIALKDLVETHPQHPLTKKALAWANQHKLTIP
jgi:outer membrane protein assembly factor BamD